MSSNHCIAIIGMHGRFPQSPSLDDFWNHLKEGRELITFFSDEALSSFQDTLDKYPNYVKAKGYLEDADYFDASFFGYSPREAELMDPQQRILLECAWHALENAGYDPHQICARIGVFVGSSISTYLMFNVLPHILQGDWQHPYTQSIAMTGNDKDFLASRISYKLNLTGPSKTIQTACSTSLVAIHDACQNLLDFSCDMAIAGGVSITCPLKSGYLFFKEGINSPDGHCRAFDAKAEGTLIGNGAGIVVLKRLENAIEDRDHIYGVIRGSAVNNDGHRKLGYTAPSVEGQTEVISEALALSEIDPETITYIEAHGTGTKIGDPIELKALSRAFSKNRTKKQYCAIGSVKTNIGHLDAAAGVAGLIKVILSMQHGIIPPTVHYTRPNPELHLDSTPFYISNEPIAWDNAAAPLRAGISSFGIGGTNAHLVVEEPPKSNVLPQTIAGDYLLTLSAHTPEALKKIKLNLIEHIQKNEASVGDISFTLNTGRRQLLYRTFFTCKDRDDAKEKLHCLLEENAAPTPSSVKPIIWVFTDFEEISQSLFTQNRLLVLYPAIKKNIDECIEKFKNETEKKTGNDFYPHPSMISFAIQYGLAKLLQELGAQPDKLLGAGVGGYVAAVIANVMSIDDAVTCLTLWLNGINFSLPPKALNFSSSIPLLSPLDPSSVMPVSLLLDTKNWMDEAATVNHRKISLEPLTPIHNILFIQGTSRQGFLPFSLHSDDSRLSLGLEEEENTFLKVLGKLWKAGYIDRWASLYEGSVFNRIVLPGYPFDKVRYWISPPHSPHSKEAVPNHEENAFVASSHNSNGFTAPSNGIEKKLTSILEQTLKNSNVGTTDNFFDLGVDSLVALEIKNSLLNQFYIDVPIQAFFDSPTIKTMASHIEHLLLDNLEALNEQQTEKILTYLSIHQD